MAAKECSDEEFIALFKEHGPSQTARILGVLDRAVYRRRERLEKHLDIVIAPPRQAAGIHNRHDCEYPARVPLPITNGIIIVGSDAHYWPDEISTAHRAFVKFAKDLQPWAIVLNGDVFDGARVSRHPPIGWEQKPSVIDELNACEERLTEIEDAFPKAQRFWTMGNHDQRFENRLAAQAPEYEGVPGFTLKDRFPKWEHAMSLWVGAATVIKHRFKGGIHATHNNTLWSGKSVVTGHLHSLKVTPFSDYNGCRFGVDTGTLADPYGPQFTYTEDNPLNHRSGFAVLTFYQGELLWPEIVRVRDENHVDFRGQVISL